MWVLFSLLMIFGQVYSETTTRYTNAKCEALDPSFCLFKKCELKILGRGIVGLNAHVVFLNGTFDKVNFSLLRKYNGFRPFMFNATVDFCKFISSKSSAMSFAKVVTNLLANNSNINHACPYNEIVVRNLVLKEEHFKYLPLPSGEYQIQIMAATNGKWKLRVKTNFLREEDILKS